MCTVYQQWMAARTLLRQQPPKKLLFAMVIEQKAALRWKRRKGSSYWDEKYLSEWIRSHEGGDPGEIEGELVEMSFPSVQTLVVLLVRRIYGLISDAITTGRDADAFKSGQRVSVSVGVAIPEGFFLPLCIAAMHILNDGAAFSVVLIPIDPAEGSIRLNRILQDCKPLLVLVAADCDFQNLQQAMEPSQEADGEFCHAFESSQPLYLAPQTCILDVRPLFDKIFDRVQQILRDVEPLTEAANWPNFRQQVRRLEERMRPRSILLHDPPNCISHIVYTSGTTGFPKGCLSSRQALDTYIESKNKSHQVSSGSVVLLASAVSFDPCFSDILATLDVGGTLFLPSREDLSTQLHKILGDGKISHVLCTPTLWSSLAVHNVKPTQFPRLRTVALGGERIPLAVIRIWARKQNDQHNAHCRLFATYGVTEACVYQTMGEVFVESGLHVGKPFHGLGVSICDESIQKSLVILQDVSAVGEVVLHGGQVDAYNSYLHRPELTSRKFLYDFALQKHCYRTGDRGFIERTTGQLQIVGRIQGESTMVKYNGIRVELGEIECAIVDDQSITEPTVVDCLVKMIEANDSESPLSRQKLCAYVVLSEGCIKEYKIAEIPARGVICAGTLLALVVARCQRKARVVPTMFIIIPKIPLTRTGKRNGDAVPEWGSAASFASLTERHARSPDVSLKEYSPLGKRVAMLVMDCLNLLPCQMTLLTTSSTFAMIGGDSLAATRVVRALYANHNNIFNGRELGGIYGILDDDTFSVRHLLRLNLGEYADFLQSRNVCQETRNKKPISFDESATTPDSPQDNLSSPNLYDMLLQSILQDTPSVALGLLEVGASPNRQEKQKHRISTTRGLRERKAVFHSTPLHLACLRGDPRLVSALIRKNAKVNIPDATGMFPLHLASTGGAHVRAYSEEEDLCRLECVKLLLEAGTPLTMKDGNKQTVIHSAARSGFVRVLVYAMDCWNSEFIPTDPTKYGGSLDWRDRWSRTPVHWAILNGNVDALQILLEKGCSPTPIKPKKNACTSVALETPLEMCLRIYGDSPTGVEICRLLQNQTVHQY